MELIIFRKGEPFKVLYDDCDHELVSKYRWGINSYGYAVSYKGQSAILMHRLILNAAKGEIIDHINRETYDNRRANLRLCSHGSNMANRASWGSSQYLGVSKLASGKYRALIQYNKKGKGLGTFISEEDAARAYDNAAKEIHGEFANLNFKS